MKKIKLLALTLATLTGTFLNIPSSSITAKADEETTSYKGYFDSIKNSEGKINLSSVEIFYPYNNKIRFPSNSPVSGINNTKNFKMSKKYFNYLGDNGVLYNSHKLTSSTNEDNYMYYVGSIHNGSGDNAYTYMKILEASYTVFDNTLQFIPIVIPGDWNKLKTNVLAKASEGDEVSILTINNDPLITAKIEEDNQIKLLTRNCYAYETTDGRLVADIMNPGLIKNISYGQFDTLEEFKLYDSADNNTLDKTEFFKVKSKSHIGYVYNVVKNHNYEASLLVNDFNYQTGILEMIKSPITSTYDDLTSVTINGELYNPVNVDDDDSDNKITYKISGMPYYSEDTLIDITSYTLSDSNIIPCTSKFNYMVKERWHKMDLQGSLHHLFDWSIFSFNIHDEDSNEYIKRDIQSLQWRYFENKGELNSENAEKLVKVASLTDTEKLSVVYASNYVSTKKSVEYLDSYGRNWHFENSNSGDDFLAWLSNQGSSWDFILKTAFPSDRVYDMQVLTATYKTKAGETISLSSYEDGLHATLINGETKVVDNDGNIKEGYYVDENGHIMTEEGNLADVDNDHVDNSGSWWDEAASEVLNFFSKRENVIAVLIIIASAIVATIVLCFIISQIKKATKRKRY